MNPALWAALLAGALAVAVLAVAFVVSLYNGIVRVRNEVRKAWSNIDVLLRQRHDELPGLVEACRQALDQNRTTLESVARLRAEYDRAATSEEKTAAENRLNRELIPVRESYPRLAEHENARQLERRIAALEDTIAARRTFFNDSVANYNTILVRLPERLLAGWLGFAPHELLEAPEPERRRPEIGSVSA